MPGPTTEPHSLPRVWRIPPWQAAALLLAVSALAALDIYGHPSTGVLVSTLFLGVVFLCLATAAARYLLVADEDGVWVRRVFVQRCVAWDELAEIEPTTGRLGSMTVRITRQNGSALDVPASLLLPTLPTGIRKAKAIVHAAADQLREIAEQQRG